MDNATKLDFMRFVGADEVVDYRAEDFTRITPRFDLVLDLVAHRSVFAYRRALAPGGVYRCVGGSVRSLLRILEEKGVLKHEYDGKRYVYVPRVARDKAVQGALDHLVATFFEGSALSAAMTLLERPGVALTAEEIERMSSLIARARKEGR